MGTKKNVFNIANSCRCHKTTFSLTAATGQNKLEGLDLTIFKCWSNICEQNSFFDCGMGHRKVLHIRIGSGTYKLVFLQPVLIFSCNTNNLTMERIHSSLTRYYLSSLKSCISFWLTPEKSVLIFWPCRAESDDHRPRGDGHRRQNLQCQNSINNHFIY